jgi:hypothetical protein
MGPFWVLKQSCRATILRGLQSLPRYPLRLCHGLISEESHVAIGEVDPDIVVEFADSHVFAAEASADAGVTGRRRLLIGEVTPVSLSYSRTTESLTWQTPSPQPV